MIVFQCAVLQARLEAAVQSQNSAEERANKLAEELAATSSGYDEQLAMLSEHLATVTEENVVCKDTIEQLRFEQNHPKVRKIAYPFLKSRAINSIPFNFPSEV